VPFEGIMRVPGRGTGTEAFENLVMECTDGAELVARRPIGAGDRQLATHKQAPRHLANGGNNDQRTGVGLLGNDRSGTLEAAGIL
jgi:hypothetical protein